MKKTAPPYFFLAKKKKTVKYFRFQVREDWIETWTYLVKGYFMVYIASERDIGVVQSKALSGIILLVGMHTALPDGINSLIVIWKESTIFYLNQVSNSKDDLFCNSSTPSKKIVIG